MPLPQQSLSLVQRLFSILQPRPGWQTLTPESAQGPQFLLQQLPQPLQRTPSCVQLPVPVVATSMQTPWVAAPEAFEQKPPQQSRSRAQTSPGWMQNDEPSAHVPFLQRPEQQPPAPPSGPAQGLPAVRQVVLSAWHFPPVQVPLQQVDELVQVAPSAVQLVALAQTPRVLSHWRLQQSVFTAQELPAAPQVVIREVQVEDVESHTCVQHSAFEVHVAPATVHLPPAPA